ncbi:MAG TPA: hypothetical protein VE422_28265 [Terriglobia bacterium]|nr:hypothetical protein [Terriglobia bacterium]
MKRTDMLSAAGVGAAIAVILPPVLGSKTRHAIVGSVRSGWRFASSNIRKAATALNLFGRPATKRASRKGGTSSTRKPSRTARRRAA